MKKQITVDRINSKRFVEIVCNKTAADIGATSPVLRPSPLPYLFSPTKAQVSIENCLTLADDLARHAAQLRSLPRWQMDARNRFLALVANMADQYRAARGVEDTPMAGKYAFPTLAGMEKNIE